MSSPQMSLENLFKFQRPKIKDSGNYGKMLFEDIKRVDLYIHSNIFNSRSCCIYTGEIKKTYSTISFRGKKVSLIRLLYHNYIDHISENNKIEYIAECDNKGICCNLNHFRIKNTNTNNDKDFTYNISREFKERINNFDTDSDRGSKENSESDSETVSELKVPAFNEPTNAVKQNTNATDRKKSFDMEETFDFEP
jgi:hypothetical protein